MYKSPVELFMSDIKLQINEKLEEACYTAVMEYFPSVDRGELLRALQYDRQQYEQGYRDAIQERDLVEVTRCQNCAWWHRHKSGDMSRGVCDKYACSKSENGYCDEARRVDDG